MDKRALALVFRDRFRVLLREVQEDLPGFLKRTGIDRSALSQLRDPRQHRLPRAETLRRIAEATGVSVDWLLGLENSRQGREKLTPSNELLSASVQHGSSPLSRWQAEAAGHKIRYVPARLPDMLSITDGVHGNGSTDKVLTGFDLEETDLEIAMPIQTIETLMARKGLWAGTNAADVIAQLTHIADTCAHHYPALRLHLFDGREHFAAPFTVFGRLRASVYVGDAYISLTGPGEVRFFTNRFDQLVRNAVVTPDAIPKYLQTLIG